MNAGYNPNANAWNNPWNQSTQTSSTTDVEGTAAEKEEVRKYNELMDEIKKYPELPSVKYKTIIDEAIEKAKDKKQASEKLEIYKKALEQIGFDTIKDVLTSAPTGTLTEGGQYYKELSAAGYEYSNTEIDDDIEKLKEVIESLDNSNGNDRESRLAGLVVYDAYSEADANHILDIISSWNTRYGKATDASKRIITLLGERYFETENEDLKNDIKDNVIKKYIDALTKKANEVKQDHHLSGEAKGTMQKAINELTKVQNDKNTYEDEEGIEKLSAAFDTLYLLLRQATISVITNDIKDKYSAISDIINEDIFKDDTVDDLKDEGFTTEEIQHTEVKVNALHVYTDETTAEEKVNDLIKEEYLTEKEVEYNNYTVYEENEKTGTRDYQRVFIIKDKDIVELKNAKIVNGEVARIDADKDITERPINEATIRCDIDKVRKAKANPDKVGDATEASSANGATQTGGTNGAAQANGASNQQLTATKTSKEIGELLYKKINGFTTLEQWTGFDGIESTIYYNVNADNVLEVIKAFNDKANKYFWDCSFTWPINPEHFFTHLITEHGNGKQTECAKKMLGYVIEHAEKQMKKYSGNDKKRIQDQVKILKDYKDKESFTRKDGREIDSRVENLLKLFNLVDKK